MIRSYIDYKSTEHYLLHCEDYGACENLKKELLEYRRENNIFDMGDYIIYEDELMVFAMWSDAINDCAYVGYAYADDGFLAKKEEFRHATDEEIKAGHRIDKNELDELELSDISPCCKKFGDCDE